LVIALSSPIYVGVYSDCELIESFVEHNKTSDTLPAIFDNLLKRYEILGLYYAKGPGSFMSIKITYIFLKSISIAKSIKLFASDGFLFNDNRPIRALKKVYFIKNNGTITTKIYKDEIEQRFSLPKRLDKWRFDTDNQPLYHLPAV
jgi:hypothetical protein